MRWLGAQVALAGAAAAAMLVVAGLVMGAGAATTLDDPAQLGRLVGAAVVTVPGVLVVRGVATAVLGLAPRAAPLVWVYVAYVGTVGMFGALLPAGTDVLSPFTHLPTLPAEPMAWPPVLAVTGVAVLLVVAGLAGVRRRDLEG
ncbi:conserved hypothetical protein [Cellulomonas flavigena DSM 20109]|uniref:Uncharacterized protein n=1 Tax=Cellulomonas flavigena (strain ATCC 482 / DSM 20109 / BCRC 11376 / JCM 18109 / NBRC 3775 / NCIMB 8073 / NRS 134) TaxID=446466 RepID=D5UII0_CELFN|nr:hypothetical protein [Cellulomonas flavigena]ADG73479.1 conserved hypothetical protein [Cellulomonas flavigena DSM 20109]